jgi:hypothetical protein
MRRISYAGATFVTSDGIADALLRFVAALGRGHQAEALEIPAVAPGGDTVVVQLVVGPTSQLISLPMEATTTTKEPESARIVDDLRERTHALAAPLHTTFALPHNSPAFDLDGFDSL